MRVLKNDYAQLQKSYAPNPAKKMTKNPLFGYVVASIALIVIQLLYMSGLIPLNVSQAIMQTMIYVVAGMGVGILLWLAGLMSFATGAFIGLGTYLAAYILKAYMVPFVLILAIVLIAKGKGVKAILGLAYSLYLVVCVLLPMVFSGYSPIAVSILCAILSVTVTLLLLNGQSKKTYAAIVSTVAGVIVSLIFFLILSNMMHLDGFSAEESEGLILIGESTGLRVKDILFAGVLISSLGAIMDTGMSIVSSLYEVYRHNTALTSRELLRSGIEIGKDMIGTMCNTLILAFTGSSFLTLLVFLSYDVQFNQLFNSNFLSMEIAQGICGSLGIVLTVPIASLITAYVLCRSPQSPETIEEDESEEEEENDEAFLERS